MTEQEIFDKVWNHLNKQGQPARGLDGSCKYRTESGLACAVGCLLDDETAMLMDNDPTYGTITSFYNRKHEIIPQDLREHVDLLERLQWAHDGVITDWLSKWRKAMYIIADDFKLKVPEVTS